MFGISRKAKNVQTITVEWNIDTEKFRTEPNSDFATYLRGKARFPMFGRVTTEADVLLADNGYVRVGSWKQTSRFTYAVQVKNVH